MKKFVLICIVLFSLSGYSQEGDFKEYSYTEFFKLIEEETDTIFNLKDALIKYNPKTDERFRVEGSPNEKKDLNYQHLNDIVVDKHLDLDNVQFLYDISEDRYFVGALFDIHFKKSVELTNVGNLFVKYCRFEDNFSYSLSNCDIIPETKSGLRRIVNVEYSYFTNFDYFNDCRDTSNAVLSYFKENSFAGEDLRDSFLLSARNSQYFYFEGNTLDYERAIFISFSDIQGLLRVVNNTFTSDFIHISKTNQNSKFVWSENTFSSPVSLEINPFTPDDVVDWQQFNNKFYSYSSFLEYTLRTVDRYPIQIQPEIRKELIQKYKDSVSLYDENAFVNEISIKSHFYSHYRGRHNTQIANKVYIGLKDFETERLKIIHQQNPSFRTYFKWKVNQFLKLFSDYGTEPSKAIVISLYVIMFFAFIYLLFPNSWDKHGRNRIMNRYLFFTKYMNKDAGIHEVYLDDQKEDLIEYHEFKNYMESHVKSIPKFFTATALPLYKWAISGTKLSASILKRVDIMKGTWSDLPKSKRVWKSILLVGAFTIAVLYDIVIKMLNALMLSINTFTTLGFGEIPIKGLPRYLAIIQGFIGWFMLTIFSVSLISQLLN